MPTVPMLAPDGSSGDIPQENVAAATAKGFKPAVVMTSPDGKTGYIPIDRQQDALGAGFKPLGPPADTRSMWQKAKDNFNSNTQGAQPGDGMISGALKDFGAGGGDVIRALAHPIDTISSAISTPDPAMLRLASSMSSGQQKAQIDARIAAQTLPSGARLAGQLGTGLAAGEMVAPLAEAAGSIIPKVAGRAVLLGKTPEGAYESAMKPSTTISQVDRAAMVKTGLQNEIPISKAGVEKIGDLIDTYNQKIAGEIASDPTRPIDPNAVAQRIGRAVPKFANQVNANGDLAAIEASKQQFLAEQGAKPGVPAIPPRSTGILDAQGNPIMNSGTPAQPPTAAPPMNAADAQAMKQGTYRVLKGKFGEQGSASVEAQKQLASGLKEEIATQFPEINQMNAAESKLLDLQPVLERAVNRVSNHQLIGIGTPVAGAAAKAVTGSGVIGAVAGVIKGVLDNPEMKSRLAIAVSKGGKIPYSQAVARVAAYSTALGSSAPAQPEYSSGDTPN